MTPATATAGMSGPASVTVDPTGKYAYVSSVGDQTNPGAISQFGIGLDGALVAMTTPTVSTGINPYSVTVDPAGRFVYVANNADGINPGSVSQYTIGADGSLTAGTTSAADVGAASVTIDPSGKYAYVANRGDGTNPGSVSQYSIDNSVSMTIVGGVPIVVPAGALKPMTTPSVAAGVYANSVTVVPSGRYAYVVNSDSVSQYSVGTDGALTPLGTPVAAGTSPFSIVVDPSGTHAYVLNMKANTILQYSIGADGTLTAMGTVTANGGYAITIDASGKYAYTTSALGGTISQYNIGASGVLTPMSPATVNAGTNPASITTTGTWQ
jgi:6-phosphogluconolactonase (cycloisomerase 2 family)